MIAGRSRAALALPLALAACVGSSTEVGSRYVKTMRVTAGAGATFSVSPAESRALAGTLLRIEPGALAATTTITLELGYQPIVRAPDVAAGPVVIWGPAGTRLDPPARLTFPYQLGDGAALPDLYVEVLESGGPRGALERAGLLVNAEAKLVTVSVAGLFSLQAGARRGSEVSSIDGGGARGDTSPAREAPTADAPPGSDCARYCATVEAARLANRCEGRGPRTCLADCLSTVDAGARCAEQDGALLSCLSATPTAEFTCNPEAPGGASAPPGVCAAERAALGACRAR
jgi:hypothetical protein